MNIIMKDKPKQIQPEDKILTKKIKSSYSWIAIVVACLIGIGIFGYAAFFMDEATEKSGTVKWENL